MSGVKKIAAISTAVTLLMTAVPVFAVPDFSVGTLPNGRTLVLPAAAENSPVIFLGSAQDPVTGGVVEGYAIVHYAKGGNGGGKPGGGGNTCYGFLAEGAKWKTVEPWVVNPANVRGLDGTYVFDNLTYDVAKWEDAADGIAGNGTSVDILGNGSLTTDALAADLSSPDGLNEVYFADVSYSGAIAVTVVWGYFRGNPSWRELIEWDMIFDDVDYDWSAAGEAGKMDFENIATHELGHSVGMADLYDSSCGEETMYGYASYGETKKRDLNAGDITGVSKLY